MPLTILVLSGCSAAVKDDRPVLNFDAFESELLSNNHLFEEVEKVPFFISAVEGKGYNFNGDTVELYRYNSDSDALEKITKNKKVEVGSFGSFPVVVNGDYILMLNDHTNSQEVIEIFESFNVNQ